jgi:hypothetical protein
MCLPRKAHSSEQKGPAESRFLSRSRSRVSPLFELTTPADPSFTRDTSVVNKVGFDRENVANLSPKTSAHHPPNNRHDEFGQQHPFPVVLRSIRVYRCSQDQG